MFTASLPHCKPTFTRRNVFLPLKGKHLGQSIVIAGATAEKGAEASSSDTETSDSLSASADGRTFSDEEWEEAFRRAPELLKKAEEEAAKKEGTAGKESAGASAESEKPSDGRMFTDAQWDAAIALALGRMKAEREKAAVDAEVEVLEARLDEAAPPVPVGAANMSISQALEFSGPAPETINGRLAMLGFLSALGAEVATGTPVAAQFEEARAAVLGTSALLIVASLVPLLQGKSREGQATGPFKPEAETLNGRAAMIGIAALIILEAARGAALF